METTCVEKEGVPLGERLRATISHITGHIPERVEEERAEFRYGEEQQADAPNASEVRMYSYVLSDTGEVYYKNESGLEQKETAKTAKARITGMVAIRDCVRELIRLQMEETEDADTKISAEQARLNALYDSYTAKWGLLNSTANKRAFSEDSSYPLLCSLEKLDAFITSPNNILAIEYEKALMDCDITGFPIQRVGEGYHSTDSTSEFSSATAVRGVISTLIDIDKHNTITNTQLDNSWISTKFSQLMPSDCADILVNCILGGHIVFPDDISEMLYYRLLTGKDKGFAQYADCTKELSAKIVKNIYKYESFTQFCNLLKSKNLTYTRISRVLTHILLGIENDDFNICMDNPYLRILGFKKSSGELMHLLKKRASAPIITKVADAPYELISMDIFAADLYGRLCHSQQNEFTHGVVII